MSQHATRTAEERRVIVPVLRQLEAELVASIQWLKQRDPKGECLRMQGAIYAYQQMIKKIKKL